MRTINDIEQDMSLCVCCGTQHELDKLWLEWFRAVAFDIEPDRLKEICDAERDGRCVVLPCEVGSDIYWIDDDNEVKCQKNGVRGLLVRKDRILIEDTDGYIDEIGTKYCYLSKEEAEKALKGALKNDTKR